MACLYSRENGQAINYCRDEKFSDRNVWLTKDLTIAIKFSHKKDIECKIVSHTRIRVSRTRCRLTQGNRETESRIVLFGYPMLISESVFYLPSIYNNHPLRRRNMCMSKARPRCIDSLLKGEIGYRKLSHAKTWLQVSIIVKTRSCLFNMGRHASDRDKLTNEISMSK